jgi:tetratricopeptide (TPR) repeat protein
MIRPALLAVLALAASSPFRTEEPHVRDGNARLRAGDAADALRLYDDAERAAGAHAEIDFARGHAALARGDLAGATDAWRRAAERASPALASRALQNVGTALAAAGERDGAARALADALSRDPSNEDARWNLEVLLRQRAAGTAPPRDPAEALPSEGGAADASGRREPGRRGADATPERRGADGDEARRDESPGRPADAARTGAAREQLSRQDAEALLDALRARERSAPFSPREARDGRRPDAAKDW